jgi:hypothetical protein
MLRMARHSRLGSIFVGVYLFIFLLTEGCLFYAVQLHTDRSEFSGLFALMVTLPWSLILLPMWQALGYIDWYGRFASSPALYGLLASVTMLPGAILNAGIAYWIGQVIDRRPAQPGGQTMKP